MFDVGCRSLVDVPYQTKKVPSHPGLLRGFIMNSAEFCQRLFLPSIEIITRVFLFSQLNVVNEHWLTFGH